MPWKVSAAVTQREEFVRLATQADRNLSRLCARFGISRKTGYKWLERQQSEGSLEDHSRRPTRSPTRTATELETRLVELRRKHPAWGARKLRRYLQDRGVTGLPASSTVTDILRRHGLITPEESERHQAWQRFEREEPNELWQMDFKGYVPMDSGRCHPLTILDDHSRYSVGLFACENECRQTVQECLTEVFRRYGLPRAMLMDNGAPWGTAGAEEVHTGLTVWLYRLGVDVRHGRPYHPQTQGKDERFHRTLKAEVLWKRFAGLEPCQRRFDEWRQEYNWERPHEALKLDVPGKHYRESKKSFPEKLPEPEFAPGQEKRAVDCNGKISLWGRAWMIGKAFAGQQVAIEPTEEDGVYQVLFFGIKIRQLDRRADQ